MAATRVLKERSARAACPAPRAGWPHGQGRQAGAQNVVSDNGWELEVDKGTNRELSMRRQSFAWSGSKLRDFFDFNFSPTCADGSEKQAQLRFAACCAGPYRTQLTQHRLSTLRMARPGLIALAAGR